MRGRENDRVPCREEDEDIVRDGTQSLLVDEPEVEIVRQSVSCSARTVHCDPSQESDTITISLCVCVGGICLTALFGNEGH